MNNNQCADKMENMSNDMGVILFDIFINDLDVGMESEFTNFLYIIQFRRTANR